MYIERNFTLSKRIARFTDQASRGTGRQLGAVLAASALVLTSTFVGASAANADPAPELDPTVITVPGTFSQTVPNGVCSVNVVAAGAAGGSSIDGQTDRGGAGAIIEFRLEATPGQLFTGDVGGSGAGVGGGGVNGGGPGGIGGAHAGGGGGGFTDISFGGDLLVLAGGGGGGGGGHNDVLGSGGNAGLATGPGEFAGSDGDLGYDNPGTYVVGGGQGGQTQAPGAGGVHSFNSDLNGFAGSDRTGGEGGTDASLDSGGGGGGGLYGAGGGASTQADIVGGGGGGGGSTFVSDDVAFIAGSLTGTQTGTNGYVEFNWMMCEYDLAVAKSSASDVFEENVPMEYTVVVTNNGPEAMTVGDTVTVTDDKASGATLTGITASDPADTPFICDVAVGEQIPSGIVDCSRPVSAGSTDVRGLNVGETLTLTYTQTVTGSDPVDNNVSITDRGNADNNAAQATVIPAAPSLSLAKTASTDSIKAAGEQVVYSFEVTNTGNIALHDIAIAEGDFSGTGTLDDAVCPAPASIAPGESTMCTATYVVTQADVDAGTITNTATAEGLTPGGNPAVSESSAAAVVAEQVPSLDLVKSADAEKATAAGQVVNYTFALTNTGNVTLHELEVTEGSFSGTGEMSAIDCPVEPLAPGESTDCTASYTVTTADLETKRLTNTASASATDPMGNNVASAPSTVEVPVVVPSGLATTGGAMPTALGLGVVGLLLSGALALAVNHLVRRRRVEA